MIAYAGFAVFMLALVATGIFPRTRWNAAASQNRLSRVEMQPAAYYAATGQSMRGVHAQERVECFLRWVALLSILAIPFMRSKWFFRQSELIGHAAEIVVADTPTYLHEEAARTYRSAAYEGLFDDLEMDGMKQALRKRFGVARVLVAINSIAIKRGLPNGA